MTFPAPSGSIVILHVTIELLCHAPGVGLGSLNRNKVGDASLVAPGGEGDGDPAADGAVDVDISMSMYSLGLTAPWGVGHEAGLRSIVTVLPAVNRIAQIMKHTIRHLQWLLAGKQLFLVSNFISFVISITPYYP